MWDFSWLERRWPGAGYEDWDQALDELQERGYDALRIDAYPHLTAAGATREWELLPPWTVQDWGAPARTRVKVQPALCRFIEKCADRKMRVALSSWFRQDVDDTRMTIHTPADHARIWLAVLDEVRAAGLLDTLLFVDLCNEFSMKLWAPFVHRGAYFPRNSLQGAAWMHEALDLMRRQYPQLPYTFSISDEYDRHLEEDVTMHDLLELHLWMVHWCDFYQQVGYHSHRTDPTGYDNLALRGEALYRSYPEKYHAALYRAVDTAANWSRVSGLPLVTTECWGIVDYKDWPLLDWGWVKELCELGVARALPTGRWAAVATSNFCGPQFRGMWRDVAWHQRLTAQIKEAPLEVPLAARGKA
nr:cellulase-like family protein [Deinococcus wulumuqiensis]